MTKLLIIDTKAPKKLLFGFDTGQPFEPTVNNLDQSPRCSPERPTKHAAELVDTVMTAIMKNRKR